MLKLCVAGAAGKMGTAVIREAAAKGFQIVGAVEAVGSQCVGKGLRELGICDSDTRIVGADKLSEAAANADVYVTFTAPAAEVHNVPVVAALGKRIVLGTTGLAEEQDRLLRQAVQGKVPAVFSPNYSVGVNILFQLAKALKAFPQEYNFSISEIHHTGKKDAPSGTAKKLGEIISQLRGYSTVVHGREGISPRKTEELEITALRAGGVPGIHDLIVAGPYEMLRIEHVAFSRSVFAQGAVYAAEWISKQREARIFSMEDVLGLA
ncbi:MAG: 4-hydroxy-tetrahydrodipicolinate reductase [Candidatus Bathyarchaeota archaeon]|nr:4-hydroxy-tetrahydrodipicolinate reductase [Candidatus Bathyarchaeota archaeon]